MVPEYELNQVRVLIEGAFCIIYLIKDEREEIEGLARFIVLVIEERRWTSFRPHTL
jgi:hypothetical protein